MRVLSKRNILFPSPDGNLVYPLLKGYIGEVPAWVTKLPYFKACVADGLVEPLKSYKDSEVVPLQEKAVPRRAKKEEAQAESAEGKNEAEVSETGE